jgi:hypothetical protein
VVLQATKKSPKMPLEQKKSPVQQNVMEKTLLTIGTQCSGTRLGCLQSRYHSLLATPTPLRRAATATGKTTAATWALRVDH